MLEGLNQEILIIGGALVLFAASALFVLAPNNSQKSVNLRAKKVMQRYSKQEEFKIASQASSLKKKQMDMKVSSSIISMPSISKLREKLDRTGRNISLMQYLMGSIAALLISAIIFKFLIGMGPILTALLAIFMGLMVPHIVVGRWVNKRMKRFMLILPDAIDLIVRGLRSGLPVTESVNVIRDEIEEPVRSVFADISQSVRIGVGFEDALMRAAKKLQLSEFNFFVISVALQRETGGNLAEILENLSSTIRARAMMKLKIKAITSEARMSAYIVGALPFLVMTVLSVLSPGYLAPLVDDVKGNIAAGVAATMFALGMGTMMKMAKFKF